MNFYTSRLFIVNTIMTHILKPGTHSEFSYSLLPDFDCQFSSFSLPKCTQYSNSDMHHIILAIFIVVPIFFLLVINLFRFSLKNNLALNFFRSTFKHFNPTAINKLFDCLLFRISSYDF